LCKVHSDKYDKTDIHENASNLKPIGKFWWQFYHWVAGERSKLVSSRVGRVSDELNDLKPVGANEMKCENCGSEIEKKRGEKEVRFCPFCGSDVASDKKANTSGKQFDTNSGRTPTRRCTVSMSKTTG
jgi:predicted RNA-binding Zn-ribbon protein involved in translation (DUF1610 family)